MQQQPICGTGYKMTAKFPTHLICLSFYFRIAGSLLPHKEVNHVIPDNVNGTGENSRLSLSHTLFITGRY